MRTRALCFYFLVLTRNSDKKKKYYLFGSSWTVSLITLLFIPCHDEHSWKMFLYPDWLAFLSFDMSAVVRTGAVLVPDVEISLTNIP